jgi:hypothetical protein
MVDRPGRLPPLPSPAETIAVLLRQQVHLVIGPRAVVVEALLELLECFLT